MPYSSRMCRVPYDSMMKGLPADVDFAAVDYIKAWIQDFAWLIKPDAGDGIDAFAVETSAGRGDVDPRSVVGERCLDALR